MEIPVVRLREAPHHTCFHLATMFPPAAGGNKHFMINLKRFKKKFSHRSQYGKHLHVKRVSDFTVGPAHGDTVAEHSCPPDIRACFYGWSLHFFIFYFMALS